MCPPASIAASSAPERDLALALRKDAGMDPGILAWLLDQFPVEPLPIMLLRSTSANCSSSGVSSPSGFGGLPSLRL